MYGPTQLLGACVGVLMLDTGAGVCVIAVVWAPQDITQKSTAAKKPGKKRELEEDSEERWVHPGYTALSL